MVAPLKIGVAGLGTVGAAVVAMISRDRALLTARCGRPVEIVAVCARSRAKKRNIDLRKIRWVSDPLKLAVDPDIDVLVEVMGGVGEPAKSAVEAALAAGKSVVTANKALLAKHGLALARTAERQGVSLNFEAAVCAAVPVIKALREGLSGNRINRVYGILNGTCNYMLTRLEREKLTFEECLRDAQRLGYAEADPSFDIEGHDTAQKLSLLASIAFGTQVNQGAVYVEGITSISPQDIAAADELGYRIKLLGVAMRTRKGIEQRVHPTMVRKDSPIAAVMGVTNALTIDADGIDPITLVGPGAGGMATASAVVADIADIARGVRVAPFGRPAAQLAASARAPMERHEGGYYIRLMARDLPGTAATIARRLAEQKISLESIVQRHINGEPPSGTGKGAVPVILMTYATSEDAVRKALAAVGRDRVISGKPQVIRIEKN
ncbi:MAG TPA: homoserine dehydrogenase [Pseudolabrys sp.]|nr:homoserine dehydrogenase [Pseudolabrys sp.]